MLETIVKTGMTIFFPLKVGTVETNESPLVNQQLKGLIHYRHKALAQGDQKLYCAKEIRNQINRDRKACSAKFYNFKFEHLNDSVSRQSVGVKLRSSVEFRIQLQETLIQLLATNIFDCGQGGSPPSTIDISNRTINQAFLAPMRAFAPLSSSRSTTFDQDTSSQVSELCGLKKLTS